MGAIFLAATALPAWSAGGGPKTQLTSLGSGGQVVHGNSSTYGHSLSANGRTALFTVNDDALPGADGTMDVYARDRRTGRTRLVSRSTSGEPANASCGDGPAISADGRLVAFECNADNLGGGVPGLFVRNLKKGTTRLASRASNGDPAADGGDRPGLSANGRFVVFESNSDNLPGAAGITDAYVRDLKRKPDPADHQDDQRNTRRRQLGSLSVHLGNGQVRRFLVQLGPASRQHEHGRRLRPGPPSQDHAARQQGLIGRTGERRQQPGARSDLG